MKLVHHKNLNPKKWYSLSIFEQMANIGSEVERTIIWKNKGNKKYADLAFERALELIDLTVTDVKNKDRLKEILRVREALADWYYFENQYQSTDKFWQKYFFAFNFAARARK